MSRSNSSRARRVAGWSSPYISSTGVPLAASPSTPIVASVSRASDPRPIEAGAAATGRDAGRRQAIDARDVIGKSAAQELVQNHAERIDVAPGIDLGRIVQELLGAHVLGGAHAVAEGHPGLTRIGIGRERLGDPKIDQLGLPGPIHQDVARLDVAVDHAPLMRVCHRVAGLDKQGHPLPLVQVAVRREAGDRHAIDDEFHGDGGNASAGRVGNARIIDVGDEGMPESGEHRHLELEAGGRERRIPTAEDDLQSHGPSRTRLHRPVDASHPAGADQFLDGEPGHDRASFERDRSETGLRSPDPETGRDLQCITVLSVFGRCRVPFTVGRHGAWFSSPRGPAWLIQCRSRARRAAREARSGPLTTVV
jgi:hypothetical protein